MYYLIISVVFSAIAIFSSFPIAISRKIPLLDVFTNFFAYATFAGCVCGVLLLVIRPLTKIKFNPNWKIFKVSKLELKFYEIIKLEKWKFIIPDCGNIVKFKKKVDISQRSNPKFYKRFLYENINASLLHFYDIVLSPLFFFLLLPEFYITIGLVVSLLIFILNIPSVMLQRSLRPRLLKIYNKLKAQELQLNAQELQTKSTI